MDWWRNILPLQGAPARDDMVVGRQVPLATESMKRNIGSDESKSFPAPDPEKTDQVMLNRSRLSRIFFLRKFFDYPVSLNYNTFANLGLKRTSKIGLITLNHYLIKINP
jgi:hypothetical protein